MQKHVETALAQLRKDEGLRLRMYLDTEGKRTIGYGHNLDANPLPGIDWENGITEEQAEDILLADVMDAETQIQHRIPTLYAGLNETRKAVVLNMVFNMGIGAFLKFRKTLSYMLKQQWGDAAVEMLDSKWAKQVGDRAIRLAKRFASGV